MSTPSAGDDPVERLLRDRAERERLKSERAAQRRQDEDDFERYLTTWLRLENCDLSILSPGERNSLVATLQATYRERPEITLAEFRDERVALIEPLALWRLVNEHDGARVPNDIQGSDAWLARVAELSATNGDSLEDLDGHRVAEEAQADGILRRKAGRAPQGMYGGQIGQIALPAGGATANALAPDASAPPAPTQRDLPDLARIGAKGASNSEAGRSADNDKDTACEQASGPPAPAHNTKLTPLVPAWPRDYPSAYRRLAGAPPDGLGRRPRQDEVAADLKIDRSTFKRYRKATKMDWPPI